MGRKRRSESDKTHSHYAANGDHVVDYSRDAGHEPHVKNPQGVPYPERGVEVGHEVYIDHAGRITSIRHHADGTHVYAGYDQRQHLRDYDPVADRKLSLVEEAERLAGQPWQQAREEFRRVFEAWKAAGRSKHRSTDDQLWQRFKAAQDRHFEGRDRAQAEVVRAKQRLVQEARALARSTDWKQAGERQKSLLEEWKKAGRASKADDDRLWQEFSSARDAFFKARTKYFEARARDAAAALDTKRHLVKEAQSLARSQDLRAASDGMKALMEKWKAAGRAPKADEDRLWKDFRAAQDELYRRRGQAKQEREQRQATARREKDRIIATAKSIAYGPDFKASREQMRRLTEEWKAAGGAGRDVDEQLWTNFKAAKDTLHKNAEADWMRRKAERSSRLQDAIHRKRSIVQDKQRRVYELENSLRELRGRPSPSFKNPNMHEIIAKRNQKESKLQDSVNRNRAAISDIESQIRDMESKLRSM